MLALAPPLSPAATRRRSTALPAEHPAAEPHGPARSLVEWLLAAPRDEADRLARQGASRSWLNVRMDEAAALPCDLPETPGDLATWMQAGHDRVGGLYADYLGQRRAGAPRRFFANRAHALYFLRGVTPTKLADGSWLAGVLPHWRNPLVDHLVRTYVEELGDGDPAKNHVLLYRRLLAANGLDEAPDLPDNHYIQAAIQLSLAEHTADLLPEVTGFNLGYEQLPLHLLITAYELNELGIDPYYFTLHVTVDNSDSGHARRAVEAVQAGLPQDAAAREAFWQRVRTGYRLNDLGASTLSVIEGFDARREVCRILERKSIAGRNAHSDYCRLGGKTVNQWLAEPDGMAGFLATLEKAGWIQRNAPPSQSRFWNLLQGPRAEMFGVFDGYELQVIHDWIRGDASADGADHLATQAASAAQVPVKKPRAFRHRLRIAGTPASAADDGTAGGPPPRPDADTAALEAQLALQDDPAARIDTLVGAMGPHQHWRPAGLLATRRFVELALH
ncbi:iron-containing redox enzyme family protein [Xylophilus sp.]|uniref:iron-containing redox enzyme family protein n=1 Tax=Xylophilus sp. TaxID=2653893 RepID=UPI0013BDF9F9|nr:iron-containing redox enzyme family protein [Xylophilus sp.]KAF1043251.1 MAG: hypothetical protein GAK38_04050 [Xylophilus sp.]